MRMLEYILRNTKTYVLQPHIYLPMYKRVPLVSNTLNGFLLKLVAEYIIAYMFLADKAPPTAQGQWVSAYNNRKDFIYE